MQYLLSPLVACYWSIISDYFSSIFSMMKSSFLKNTIPMSYVQHSFHGVYLYNKKKQSSEVYFNLFFVIFMDKLGAIFCEFRHMYTRKWKWRVLRVRVVYLLLFFIEVNLQPSSPIHEISYLAIYAGQLEAEKYV